MKINQLLKHEFAYKLKKYSFHNRQLNKDILSYYNRIFAEFQFVEREIERVKSEYTNQEDVKREFEKIENIEIEDIPKFKLVDEDFDNCFYPSDKNYVLTEEEIQSIIKWCEESTTN